MLCEHALGERAAIVNSERSAGVDQRVVVQVQAPTPVGECKRADVLGLVVQAHDRADAADEADARVAGALQCVERVEHGLAQVGAHRVEPVGGRVRVDERAVRQRAAQLTKLFACERGGADRDESVVVVGGVDQFVDRCEERERGPLLFCGGAQFLAQRLEVGVLQFIDLRRGIEHGDHTARERGVAELGGRAHDPAACLRGDAQLGVAIEQTRDGRLRNPCEFRDLFACGHAALPAFLCAYVWNRLYSYLHPVG